MKHLCNCGEIVDAEGDSLKVATCKNCGMYYVYASEIVDPLTKNELLLKDIESKVHSHREVVEELCMDKEDAIPFVRGEEKPIEPTSEEVKVRPRPAKRR